MFLISHLHVPRSSPILSQLKVGPVDGFSRDYMPGKSFSFQIRGDPGAKVSLVAVDNAVYLLRRDRLTQRKVCFLLTLEAVKAPTDSQSFVLTKHKLKLRRHFVLRFGEWWSRETSAVPGVEVEMPGRCSPTPGCSSPPASGLKLQPDKVN